MPPKKTTTTSKTTTKAPAKSTTTKTATKPGATKSTTTKTTKDSKTETAKPAAEPVRKPVTFTEINFKEIDKKIVNDLEGIVKGSGKWALVVDENGLTPRFLRHRDVNMLTAPINTDMEPEKIRKALIGSIKWGKPFIIDMVESEMYEYCKDQFDKIQPNLLDSVLDKSIVGDDFKYMSIVKEEDGVEFQN